MNERIRELALEVFSFKYKTDPNELNPGHNMDHLHKFAELIIQDCIAIVEPSSYRRAYPDNYRGGIDCMDTLDDRVEKIKEHFGVEE